MVASLHKRIRKELKMKKKFLYVLCLGILTISLTGCVKYNATMNIKSNKSMNFSIISAIDTSIFKDQEIVSEEERGELEKRGFIVSDYEEDSMKGVIVSRKIKNIDAISSIDNVEYSLSKVLDDESSDTNIFKVKKGFLKNTYTATFTFNASDSNLGNTLDTTEETDNEWTTTDEEWSWETDTENLPDFSNALSSSMDLSFNVNLPYSAKSNNATNTNNGNKNLSWDLTSDSVNKIEFEFELYNFLAIGIIAGAVICFVLLIIQAAYLIMTTGRESREDKHAGKVVLRGFDKFPTELWFLIYVLSIGASALFVWIAMQTEYDYKGRTALSYISSMGELRTVLIGVLSSVIFGFVFMQLTLSFARRIKAHNLRSRLYVRGLYKRLMLWVKSKKSADRLMIYTAAYIVIEILLVAYIAIRCYRGAQGETESVLIGEILFVVMWVVTIAAMRRISSDIKKLEDGVARITEGDLDTKVEINSRTSIFRELARGVNHIGDGLKTAVETSLKDERMKTELITNVSHDLKTPLTSIINYINLLKRESMPTPAARHYVEVLDSKAHRLSQLTEDLVEAAKATSGNIELNMMPISFDELMKQALGEFEDKFAEKQLTVVAAYPKTPVVVLADGRRLFRILDNVLQNAYKYAMERTRIYVELYQADGTVCFVMKNISAAQLNISAEELMERFTRGDSSRTTEGSGLGLSIAKDLTRLMEGSFDLELDGDLFKVILTFPEYQREEMTEQKPDVQESVVQNVEDAGADKETEAPEVEIPEASKDAVEVPEEAV